MPQLGSKGEVNGLCVIFKDLSLSWLCILLFIKSSRGQLLPCSLCQRILGYEVLIGVSSWTSSVIMLCIGSCVQYHPTWVTACLPLYRSSERWSRAKP